jgi:hypothetical protein
MFLREIPKVLLRRWYVVVLGLLATVGLVFAALSAVSPTYTLNSEVLLLPPPSAVPAGSNPYLVLGGLEGIGTVASRVMTADSSQRYVKAQFGTVDLGVALDPTAAAPMILIEVSSSSPKTSQAVEQFLSNRIPDVLLQLQKDAKVPSKSLITSTSVFAADIPQIGRKSQIRAAVVAAAAGLLVTILAAAAVDARTLRRRPARSRQQVAALAAADAEAVAEAGKGLPGGKAKGRAEDPTRVPG